MDYDSKKQKMYDALRGQISGRLIRAIGIAESDIENLSLAELLNILFVMHGDGGSTGNFSVTFGAALKFVGRELMWLEPEAKPADIEAEQRVN
jgi:hypothetical protein